MIDIKSLAFAYNATLMIAFDRLAELGIDVERYHDLVQSKRAHHESFTSRWMLFQHIKLAADDATLHELVRRAAALCDRQRTESAHCFSCVDRLDNALERHRDVLTRCRDSG